MQPYRRWELGMESECALPPAAALVLVLITGMDQPQSHLRPKIPPLIGPPVLWVTACGVKDVNSHDLLHRRRDDAHVEVQPAGL